ncbi:hypothetical protein AGMMS50230_20380 [Spirochaetia bacterium]|nr:hypothetical protein AGMMS50230_20380 [Spirochaetia bacterium]
MANILLGKPKSLRLNSFFVVRKYVIDELLSYKGPYPNIGGLVLRITKNITNARIEHQERIIGKSGYTFGKLLALWLNGFTAFSVKPLRMASLLGFCISFMGFMYSIYLIVKKIINPSMVLGYTSMMAAILFVGGVLMLLLGLIGEYIGRIYITINNAPQYVIKEIVRGES